MSVLFPVQKCPQRGENQHVEKEKKQIAADAIIPASPTPDELNNGRKLPKTPSKTSSCQERPDLVTSKNLIGKTPNRRKLRSKSSI